MNRCEEILAHHGVKGMKWGVRNGPPYPISNSYKFKANMYKEYGLEYSRNIDKKLHRRYSKPNILDKDTTLHHITTNENFADDLNYPGSPSKRLFTFYTDIDNINYAAFFAKHQKNKGKSVYDAIEDINDTDKNNMMYAIHPLIILNTLESVGDAKVSEIKDDYIVALMKKIQGDNSQ